MCQQGGQGYPAASVWDACTGWGSPNDAKLLAGLKNLAELVKREREGGQVTAVFCVPWR